MTCARPTALTTDRLILRRWRPEDVAPMARINADPEVMRWIGDGGVRDPAQTRAAVAARERHWEDEGFGLFGTQEKATGELIGFVGLAVPHFLPEVMPSVEIGWRLGRRHWGRGLATEAAREVLRFGRQDCGLTRIVSIAQVGNDASIRIMTKLGLTPALETVDPSCGRPVIVYEWRADPDHPGRRA